MSATSAQQLHDANGHIIVDQYYDEVQDKYLPGSLATAGLSSISDQLPPILGQQDVTQSLSVTPPFGGMLLGAAETHIGSIGGQKAVVQTVKVRPADTNAYAANDSVSDSTSAPTNFTFASLARVAGGTGYIVKARLITNNSATAARFRLHLFLSSVVGINDNAAYTALWAQRADRLGYIDFAALSTEGSGSDSAASLNATVRLPYNCGTSLRTIYGLLETLDAFTPASAQNFFIELTSEND